ncbi:Galactose oxidase/kelch repeat superfamily protein [Euphorbia peplus]|nr:Galactose oxidase/kelch repeat superfamily protein [Euphorbia peplus]
MHRAKKPNLSGAHRNDQIYMELNEIIREKSLQYLPAKSLRRYTGVSKDWKLHISSPFFAHSQSNSFQDISGFFFQTGASAPSFVSLDAAAYGIPNPSLTFLPDKVNIKSSSYGLLCCQGQTGTRPYYICNPVTQRWKELPKPKAYHGSDPALVLIFKPSLLNFVVEFKLVCAFTSARVSSDLNICEFDIYSSSDNSWRRSHERISLPNRKIIPSSGVHADGIIYWKTKSSGILTFDLKKEQATPSDFDWDGYYCCSETYFGELNGKLCCARVHLPRLNIELLEYPEFNSIKYKEPVIFGGYLFSLDEELSVMAELMHVGGKVAVIQLGSVVVLYNLETQDVKELCAAEENTRWIPYVNSLVEI